MRNIDKMILIFVFLLLFLTTGYTQNVLDYLILESIGSYSNSGKGRCGKGSGILAAAGHFGEDHQDITCRTGYYNLQQDLAVSIQVTQHAGADSDRWLLHEVEDAYRDGETETLGLLTEGAILRKIDGNRVFWIGLGGGSFTWLSNNIVVKISYTDLQGTKPEPLEVVRAYLQKFPSTIPAALVLDRAHDERWIKDEMERRLWLSDKWFLHLQMGRTEQNETFRTIVKSMFVFLDYRERYYGIKARDEKILLDNYLINNDGTAIKTKLAEYKTWWRVNKAKSINLP